MDGLCHHSLSPIALRESTGQDPGRSPMIVSHKWQFIFVHCRKTAGSSIAAYLNPYLGWSDIQIGAWHHSLNRGGRMNIRFLLDVSAVLSRRPRLLRRVLTAYREGAEAEASVVRALNHVQKRRYSFSNPTHPLAVEVERAFPREWKEYYKFCFVRNPYEKAVSDYIWRVSSRGKAVAFREFLLRVADPERGDPEGVVPANPTNFPMYTLDGAVAVDHVGRYESLYPDLREVLDHLGIPFEEKDFPRTRQKKRYDYRRYYGDEERELVEQIYQDELSMFDYEF